MPSGCRYYADRDEWTELTEDDEWTELTEDNVEAAEHRTAQLALAADPQVGVIYLGNRLRIYNRAGRWLPATLTLFDDQEQIDRTVRLDLPPSGVVRTVLPALAGGEITQTPIDQTDCENERERCEAGAGRPQHQRAG